MSWLVFYPRALWRVIRHPVSVARYTKRQLHSALADYSPGAVSVSLQRRVVGQPLQRSPALRVGGEEGQSGTGEPGANAQTGPPIQEVPTFKESDCTIRFLRPAR